MTVYRVLSDDAAPSFTQFDRARSYATTRAAALRRSVSIVRAIGAAVELAAVVRYRPYCKDGPLLYCDPAAGEFEGCA